MVYVISNFPPMFSDYNSEYQQKETFFKIQDATFFNIIFITRKDKLYNQILLIFYKFFSQAQPSLV